jgi:hypothetical protein
VVARGWETRESFNGYRILVLQDEKSCRDLLHSNVHIVSTTVSDPKMV